MNKLNAYRVYLMMQGAHGLIFFTIVTVNLVYQATVVGLNPLQLVLVGTVLESSVLLFEIPTGIVADVYSRRLSVIIGFFLMGLGFMLAGAIPRFEAVLLAQVIWGSGATFLSGASEAWVADEMALADSGTKATIGQVFLRGTQLYHLGALVGIGVSVTLASLTITLPIVLGGGLFIVLAIWLALVMPERGFSRANPNERQSWQAMAQTLQGGVRLIRIRPVLLVILGVSVIFGMTGEGYDRLWTPHILDNFALPSLGPLKPIVWFGLMNAVSMFLTLGMAEFARRRIDTESQQSIVRALMLITALLSGGIVIFGLTTSFGLALLAFWSVGTLRATLGPLYLAWINQHIETRVRATMLSINSQADALGQIAGGPAIGAIGTIVSLRAALTMAGIVLTPALVLYARTLRRTVVSTVLIE